MSAEAGLGDGRSGRANLAEMRRTFERNMDPRLIMEYVKELRGRKELLLSSLKATGGMITPDISSVIEELAEINPSGGCGDGEDKGAGHYSGMLNGYWVAASTLVPGVPYSFQRGEGSRQGEGTDSSPPTCALGDLIRAMSGQECHGDFDPATPVRPRRMRFSVLKNTVRENQMPNLVAIVRYGHVDKSGTGDATGVSPDDESRDPEAAVISAVRASATRAKAAAAAAGSGVLASGFEANPNYSAEEGELKSKAEIEAAAVAALEAARPPKAQELEPATKKLYEDGGVKIRAVWGVEGGCHLTWALENVDVDLGERIVRTMPAPPKGDGEDEPRWKGQRRDVYEHYLDQNMVIFSWKAGSPGPEDYVVFVRDEVSN